MKKEKIDHLYEELKEKVNPSNISLNEPMKKHTSFKVGGEADVFIKIQDQEELKRSFTNHKE